MSSLSTRSSNVVTSLGTSAGAGSARRWTMHAKPHGDPVIRRSDL